MEITLPPPPDKEWIVEERGKFRFPPGLKRNLPFYLARRFFQSRQPYPAL